MAGPPERTSTFTPVRLAVRVERAGHHLVLGVDRGVGPDQVVGGAVLRLGEPVGLDDDRCRAHVRRSAAPRRRRRRRSFRARRRCSAARRPRCPAPRSRGGHRCLGAAAAVPIVPRCGRRADPGAGRAPAWRRRGLPPTASSTSALVVDFFTVLPPGLVVERLGVALGAGWGGRAGCERPVGDVGLTGRRRIESYQAPMTACWRSRTTGTPRCRASPTARGAYIRGMSLELLAYCRDQDADALVAPAEEEVADDRADHREPGRDAQPGEHRRQGRREHHLAQA